jgi:hypothetical protein
MALYARRLCSSLRELFVSGKHPNTWELIMGEQAVVRLNVTAHNYGESAYDAWLYVSHPASLNYTAHKTDVRQVLNH